MGAGLQTLNESGAEPHSGSNPALQAEAALRNLTSNHRAPAAEPEDEFDDEFSADSAKGLTVEEFKKREKEAEEQAIKEGRDPATLKTGGCDECGTCANENCKVKKGVQNASQASIDRLNALDAQTSQAASEGRGAAAYVMVPNSQAPGMQDSRSKDSQSVDTSSAAKTGVNQEKQSKALEVEAPARQAAGREEGSQRFQSAESKTGSGVARSPNEERQSYPTPERSLQTERYGRSSSAEDQGKTTTTFSRVTSSERQEPISNSSQREFGRHVTAERADGWRGSAAAESTAAQLNKLEKLLHSASLNEQQVVRQLDQFRQSSEFVRELARPEFKDQLTRIAANLQETGLSKQAAMTSDLLTRTQATERPLEMLRSRELSTSRSPEQVVELRATREVSYQDYQRSREIVAPVVVQPQADLYRHFQNQQVDSRISQTNSGQVDQKQFATTVRVEQTNLVTDQSYNRQIAAQIDRIDRLLAVAKPVDASVSRELNKLAQRLNDGRSERLNQDTQERVRQITQQAAHKNLTESENFARLINQRVATDVQLSQRIARLDAAMDNSRLQSELAARQMREIARELSKQPNRASDAMLERVREAAERAARQNANFRQQPDFMRAERFATNQLLGRQLQRIERVLDGKLSAELSARQAEQLSKLLAKLNANALSNESADRLRKLLARLDAGLARKDPNFKLDPRQAEQLVRQIRALLMAQRNQTNQNATTTSAAAQREQQRQAMRLNQLSSREQNLVSRIDQLKEALRLQQLYARQLGNKLSVEDRKQLQKQERILQRRIDRLEDKLNINRQMQRDLVARMSARQQQQNQMRTTLSVAERQALLQRINERTNVLNNRVRQIQEQLKSIREQIARNNDPRLLRALQRQEQAAERRIAIVERELSRLRAQRLAVLQRDGDRRGLSAQDRERIGRLQRATQQRQQMQRDNPDIRQLMQLRARLITLRASLRDALQELTQNAQQRLSQALREQISTRLARVITEMSQRNINRGLDSVRLRRLEQIQLMLKEGQEISARMLQDVLNVTSEELEEGNDSLRQNRRNRSRSSSRARSKSKTQERGFGLQLENGNKAQTKKTQQPEPAAASGTRLTTNARTGRAVAATNKGPARSLDIAQSKEDDGEKNEYWKEVHGEIAQ